MRNPAESPNWTAFVEPLRWGCWAAVAAVAMAVPPLMAAAASAIGRNDCSNCICYYWILDID